MIGILLLSLVAMGHVEASDVSLTGVISTATDHGRTIQSWIDAYEDPSSLPEITTTATIVKSVEGILETAHRQMPTETLGVIGLGSIGNGTLHLMLEVLPHPKKLLICDPYQNDDTLARVVESVRESGYNGQLEIVKNGGALPPEIYESTLIVASTNAPGILDIERLNPGTLVVDYSFPPVFRVLDAIQRYEDKADFLFTTGGELRVQDVIEETIYLPEDAEDLAEGLETAFLRFLSARDKHEITGCILVSQLTSASDFLTSTQGPLTKQAAVTHFQNLNAQTVSSAQQQMHGYFPDGRKYQSDRSRLTS